MALYSYIKIPPGKGKFFIKKKVFLIKLKKNSPFFLFTSGFIFISTLLYSLFSYKLLVFKRVKEKIVAPISEVAIAEAKGFVNPLIAGVFTQAEKEYILKPKQKIDYELINNWFPTAVINPVKSSKITHYVISIPKLRIKNAVTEVGVNDIKKSLAHYPGTAFPGEFGNTVIFGHSVLPIFYNPKDYKTIFSLIPTLKNGDKIYVFFDGIEFIYEVVDYKEVKPEEINVLEQRFDQQTLSLITCVPPGTYLKRGIIKARLLRL